MRCEHCSNHQMRRTPSEPSANKPSPPSFYEVPAYSTRGGFGLVWVKACAGRPGPWSALAFVPTRLG